MQEKHKVMMIPIKADITAIIILLLTQVAEAAPIAVDHTHSSQSATTVTATKRDTPAATPEVIGTASAVAGILGLMFIFYCYQQWKQRRDARERQGKDNAFEMAVRIGVERRKLAAAKNGTVEDVIIDVCDPPGFIS
ncbi:hypothetical protein F5144DRAFT_644513 [Chaetomium tenue]|uniref:Uncharacterized protein n=1 Tax=Chaetomium tenue TaxID=1854479 RepID=A0ACB7PCH5_9PEZI|nr:hypothetical protein F5144DRAFT_644513 [Chaetomium globosum]